MNQTRRPWHERALCRLLGARQMNNNNNNNNTQETRCDLEIDSGLRLGARQESPWLAPVLVYDSLTVAQHERPRRRDDSERMIMRALVLLTRNSRRSGQRMNECARSQSIVSAARALSLVADHLPGLRHSCAVDLASRMEISTANLAPTNCIRLTGAKSFGSHSHTGTHPLYYPEKMIGQARPLAVLALALIVGLQAASSAYQSYSSSSSGSSSSSSTITTSSLIRLKANRLRRPESCREQLPRKSEDLPALVITGRVKEVYLAGEAAQATAVAVPATVTQQQAQTSTPAPEATNHALVTIGRVIKGNQQLLGSDIIVSGFNSTSSTPCPNYVKPNDTLILFLNHEGDRKYSVQGNNLLVMNLNNLDRVNALAADEPYKRRGTIEDILCEAHYCAYGRCVVLSEQPPQVTCKCPDSCPPVPAPVCGSDNTTYTNECHLIREGCRIKRPLFVTKLTSC